MSGRPTNPLALWALFTGVMLLAPVAVILAVIALWQIKNRPEKGDGAPFAIMALILGGVLLPGGAWFVLQGSLPAMDGCQALQREGAAELRLIAFLQQRYRDDHGRYGASFAEIGFKDPTHDSPYVRRIVSADDQGFVAEAVGEGPMARDHMEIGPAGEVVHIHNVCAK